MYGFWNGMEKCSRKEVFAREVRAHDAESKGDFEIKYLNTNKSQNFWHGMDGKEVFLRGQLLHVDAKEKLIVFTAVCCKNAQGLAQFTDEQLIDFEIGVKDFSQEMRSTLYEQLAGLEKWEESRETNTSLMFGMPIEKMKAVFSVMRHLLSKEVVGEIQRCIDVI